MDRYNAARRDAPESGPLEELGELLFAASSRLIVYGSLAPGRPNHHQVEGLGGRWSEGWVHGTLHPAGWGAVIGYPVLIWDHSGPRIPAHLLESDDLPEHWARLDEFEGPEYRRILATFHQKDRLLVGNVYEYAGRDAG